MCENYYESITHVMFRMTGFDVVSEMQSIAGRSDIIVSTDDSVFIFELKMDKGQSFDTVADEALKQIDDKGYTQRYAVSGKTMYKVAVVYASDATGMTNWKYIKA